MKLTFFPLILFSFEDGQIILEVEGIFIGQMVVPTTSGETKTINVSL